MNAVINMTRLSKDRFWRRGVLTIVAGGQGASFDLCQVRQQTRKKHNISSSTSSEKKSPPSASSTAISGKHSELLQAYQLLAKTGYYDLVWTLISRHYPSTNTYGILKYPTPISSVESDEDILEFDGIREAHPAWGLHKSIHHALGPAAAVVIHNHDDVSVQFSTANRTVRPLIQESVYFYGDRMITFDAEMDSSEIPGRLFKDTIAVNLLNHGSLVWGRTIAEAFMRFYYLRRCMKTQMLAESMSVPIHEPSVEFVKTLQERWEDDNDPVFGGMINEYNALLAQHGLFDETMNTVVPRWE